MEVNIKYRQQKISTITRIQLKRMHYIPIFLLLFLIDFSFGQKNPDINTQPVIGIWYDLKSYYKNRKQYKRCRYIVKLIPERNEKGGIWVASPQLIFNNDYPALDKRLRFEFDLYLREFKKLKYYAPFETIYFWRTIIKIDDPEDSNKSIKPFRLKLIGRHGKDFEGSDIKDIVLQYDLKTKDWYDFKPSADAIKKGKVLQNPSYDKIANPLRKGLKRKEISLKNLTGRIIYQQLEDTILSVAKFNWVYEEETSVDYLSPWILEAKVDYEIKRINQRLFLISDGIPMRKKRHNWFGLVRNKILEFIPHPDFKGSRYAVATGSSNANTLSLLMPLTPGGSESNNLDQAYIEAGKSQSGKDSQRIVDILKNLPQFYVDNEISANTDVVLFFATEWSYMKIEPEELEQLLDDLPKSIGDLHLFHISKKGNTRYKDFDDLITEFNKQDWAHSHDIFEEDIPTLDKIILSRIR